MIGKITLIKFNQSNGVTSDRWLTVHVLYEDGSVNRLGSQISDIQKFANGMQMKEIYNQKWDIGEIWQTNKDGRSTAKLQYMLKV